MADQDIRAAPSSAEGRVLVLCFDGTANEFDDKNTNVAKLFSFLEKSSPKQLVYYQTGIGTYIKPGTTTIFKWLAKTADEGVALYLSQHINAGYHFLQQNWEPGDKICLFGFSRGAYTARALAGMLYTVGLLPKGMPEQVDFAYSIYKKGVGSAAYKRAFSRTVTIEFLGVWDTVSSVGAVFPRVLPFSSDNHITKTFRHAVSLDEHRAKFRANTWHLTVDPDEEDETNMPSASFFGAAWRKFRKLEEDLTKSDSDKEILEAERWELDREGGLFDRPPTDVREVWFSGCHCDVGGGNGKDSDRYMLSNVPLRWMLKEIIAADTGIMFRKGEMQRYHISYDRLVEEAAVSRVERAQRDKERLATMGDDMTGDESPTRESWMQVKPAQDATVDQPLRQEPIIGETPVPEIPTPEAKNVKSPEGGAPTDDRVDNEISANDSDAVPKAPGSNLPKNERQTYKDSVSPITDELKRKPFWWLLEFLPFIDSHQDEHGHWRNYVRVNMFRKRDIPMPPAPTNPNSVHNKSRRGVNLPSHTLVHISVKQRMEAEDCKYATWRTLWRKKTEYYRPRAWPRHGDPVFVE